MEPNTKRFLRSAALEALKAEEDVAAMELLVLMVRCGGNAPLGVLPSGQPTTEGPARDYHFWMQYIRERFIPFMTKNGRQRFTSHELLSYIENDKGISLTDGDMKPLSTGNRAWRERVGDALSRLKAASHIEAPPNSRDYRIVAHLRAVNAASQLPSAGA